MLWCSIREGYGPGGPVRGFDALRQRSEQYLTCSQSRSHFLRQVKGSEQNAHSLDGSSDFLRIFMTVIVRPGCAGRRARAKKSHPMVAFDRFVLAPEPYTMLSACGGVRKRRRPGQGR